MDELEAVFQSLMDYADDNDSVYTNSRLTSVKYDFEPDNHFILSKEVGKELKRVSKKLEGLGYKANFQIRIEISK